MSGARRGDGQRTDGRRTILITGCSSGVGRDAAETLAARGWHVFATCRQPGDVAHLKEAGLDSLQLDLADPGTIAAAFDAVLAATGGRLDAVFNNGAFALPGALEDVPGDALRAIFEANVFGWHEVARRAIPAMRARGGGRIVQCSSVLGFVPARWRGAYVATKYAIEGLSDTLRMEMAGTGIHIVLIEPGPIATRIRVNAAANFARWIDWKASPRASQYRAELIPRLQDGRPDRFERPPAAVTAKLIHALEAPRPRPRYFVTTPTYLAAGVRLMPTRLRDRILGRT